MYGLSELPGGLRVITATMPHLASVAVGLWVNTGGRHESARENGAAHFIEHMLFKGTRRRSAARISQDVEGIGAGAGERDDVGQQRLLDRLEGVLEGFQPGSGRRIGACWIGVGHLLRAGWY